MENTRIAWLSADTPPNAFPDVGTALREPDGLLAGGGDLSPARLLYAYQHGIFPWYDEGEPILWWSPDPRCVFYPERYRVARRLRRDLKNYDATVTFNQAFDDVVAACAGPRRSEQGTWITTDIMDAYGAMHRAGWAHSVELWRDGQLIGGSYGMAIGKVFFGESMFSHADNASKLALMALCRVLTEHDFRLFDCQVVSEHLLTLGAEVLPRKAFVTQLEESCYPAVPFADWPQGHVPVQDFQPAAGDTSLQ